MAETNWVIPEFEGGKQLWDKYKQNQDLRYRLSQTDIFFNMKKAKLRIENTMITPDENQSKTGRKLSTAPLPNMGMSGIRRPSYDRNKKNNKK